MFKRETIYDFLKRCHEETLIMGILNVTPDSFSDGGKFYNIDYALKQGIQMVQDGAHMIDIGGESTRPGHEAVSEDEELSRVIPVIEKLSKEIDVPISIDTYKSVVAKEAIQAGASIINDVWGAKRDTDMSVVAKEMDVPIILMHNRLDMPYTNFLEDVKQDLSESIQRVKAQGVEDYQIILDPGIGFAKDFQQNIEMMQNLEQLHTFGYPVLLAASRKRMIGTILDLPVDDRLEGSLATVCFGVTKGVHMVRVHDVKETKRAIQVMDILYGKRGLPNG